MSLPIVMIFERHMDPTPSLLIKKLIPQLAKEGYDRFCQELPPSFTEESALYQVSQAIQLIESNNTSRWRKHLPTLNLKRESLLEAKKHSFCVRCIDEEKSYHENNSTIDDIKLKHETLRKTLPKRDIEMADQLFHMHAEKKGVLAPIGAMHYNGIVKRLKEKGLSDEDFICHFPQSSPFFSRQINELDLSHEEAKNLKEKTSCTTTGEEINLLGQKILAEIKSKNKRYISVINENCHSEFLSDFFKANFKAFLRPGYRVDALLSFDQMIEIKGIKQQLEALSIQNHTTNRDNQNYLVIPDVNTNQVGHQIRLLPYKV